MRPKYKNCVQCNASKPEDLRKCCGPVCVSLRAQANMAKNRNKNPYNIWMRISAHESQKLEADKRLARARKEAIGPLIT